MSADKHRNLEIKASYLRLAASENGLGLNIQWAHKLTPFLRRLIDKDLIVLRTVGANTSKTRKVSLKSVTTAFITEAGRAELARLETRFGEGYGGTTSARRAEAPRPKDIHRHRVRESMMNRIRRSGGRRAVILSMLAADRG